MIELTEDELIKCKEFAEIVTKNTVKRYKERNPLANTDKIIQDHYIAKLSEIAVYKHLIANNRDASYPSFKLEYDQSEDCDIYINGATRNIRLHCKVCRDDSRVKDSWLIQANSVPKLDEDDYFALCRFRAPNNIEILKIISSQDIIWKPTKIYMPSKLACYLSDMI